MAKNFKQVKRKLKKLIKDENQEGIGDLVKRQNNVFFVYDDYKVIKDKHQFKIYTIDNNEYISTVFNSSSAISWCNAHKGNDVVLADNILSTDRAIEFIGNDITYTKMLIKLKSTSHTNQSILFARLTEYVNSSLQLKLNLHKYIQRSKQIKSKGFSNEFTAPIKTKEFKRVR